MSDALGLGNLGRVIDSVVKDKGIKREIVVSALEQAILAAAQSLRSGEPVSPPQIVLADTSRHAIGSTQIRPDAVAKATGSAVFSDDLAFEGMLFGRVKRAGVPHAIVTRIEVEKARKRDSCVDSVAG